MMDVGVVDIDSLVLDPQNLRAHDQINIDVIKGSLKRFGQQKPIVVGRDRVVIAGNGTLTAARELGWKKISVSWSELEGSERTAFGVVDNRSAELATWDTHLAESLGSLYAEDPELLNVAGFTFDQLEEMTCELEDVVPDSYTDDDDDDEEQELEIKAEAQLGDTLEINKHTLFCGDCVEMLRKMDDNCVDSVVTDPPYGIAYQSRDWDCDVPGPEFAGQVFRVLKPGGYLVAFAATRTIHRLAVSLEDAGFEIRDQMGWLTWQGFPKSMALDGAIKKTPGSTNKDAKRFEGYGTALKPALEPAIVCRKPLEGTVAENALKWGTGGMRVAECRIPHGDTAWPGPIDDVAENGRWPANVYYCKKPNRHEKEQGCEDLQGKSGASAAKRKSGTAGLNNPRAGANRTASHVKNYHPTVKPIKLMEFLVKLFTPHDGIVLDPFCGSGTTMVAAEHVGVSCIGSEREPDYCDIIKARVKAASGE